MSASSLPFGSGASRPRVRPGTRAVRLPRPELLGLLVLAAVLNLWALGRNGLANEYYAAAVHSMASGWHAFLFGSFDQGGVMTVDKPPAALWAQALSVRVFGFSTWSMLAPQALMGVASVAIAHDLVRRRFGRAAGFSAGLVLALTPVTVAVSRHNNPDAMLVLCSVAALWSLVRALEEGRTRWLVWCGVMVGLGFEAKMAAALLVVPALAAAYLWVAPAGRLAAVKQLAIGGATMIAVSCAWPVLVWLTPEGSRPWVSGTSDNSIWSLILGYNGFGRLLGQDGGPGGGAGGPGGGGPGGGVFGGETGPLRLIDQAMGGQAGWLLGTAIVAGLGLLVATRLRRSDERTGWLIAAGGCFVTIAVAFSTAQGIFHPYYVSLLAPFTAVLVGAGVALAPGGGLGARVLAPLGIVAGIAVEAKILGDTPTSLSWLPDLLVVGGLGLALALAVAGGGVDRRLRVALLTAAFALLLVAPATWSVQTLGHPTSSTFPAGGPQSAGGMGMGGPGGGPGGGGMRGQGGPPPAIQGAGPRVGGGGPFGADADLTGAIAYARAHGGGTVAVSSQNGSAGTVITSGADVAAIGGFSGRESQVSTAWLADAVDAGRIRWVLTDGDGGAMRDGRIGSRAVMSDVASACAAVSAVDGLYDCAGSTAKLRAR